MVVGSPAASDTRCAASASALDEASVIAEKKTQSGGRCAEAYLRVVWLGEDGL